MAEEPADDKVRSIGCPLAALPRVPREPLAAALLTTALLPRRPARPSAAPGPAGRPLCTVPIPPRPTLFHVQQPKDLSTAIMDKKRS
eukprot:CAMPEP_0182561342 /NCGR_PEP_ID=MMETSP1324-20130603/3837_1 /TAXON_ID=236786 /ORGANISM="Florenciella sp., Strain RCC1587" /LENGTH=86 /DNA_ID=CAMNT_0024773929 /DNA_START=12 /DNA_END=267 /DNA_ORIENTATION=+